MAENIFGPMLEGARDALRLFVALIQAPFSVLAAFVRRTDRERHCHLEH